VNVVCGAEEGREDGMRSGYSCAHNIQVAHAINVVADVVVLALLVTQPALFLSNSCNS
jgi:hypothetical protein